MISGALIREARSRAQLSQADLARRAGVAQSVISAYEAGRREPGLGMLSKLIEAAGHDLVIELRPNAAFRRGLPDTRIGRRLRQHRQAIIETAARRGARTVRVFGSAATGTDVAGSDIDLLVDLDLDVGLVGLAGLTRELTELLGINVDVIPANFLRPAVRDQAMAEAIPL